ncbi:TBPIP-domain-containing protein [Mytilinidion resinicola]|uniref:TBPIP-domain-containing protein n=1 Tax=Mytilinidion resinicola TaxID=574789 RepID=A0A6A6Y6Q3_9PEZI|nr:TBPIP-domain-containing protein [Mytilinidion resinicola]KAF2803875.1 TBPIP-domain-containing protein [Mytilinidion resinicola]
MAPRKEKTEKVSGDAAADTILTYLRKQNRPYSATDVSANLHNKVTKAAAAKILKDLHEKKEIEGRASGKQIVYHCVQSVDDAVTPEHLAEIDNTISTLRAETTTATASAKTLRASLASLNTTLSTSDLRSSIAKLEAEREDYETRLGALRGGQIRPVKKEEKEKADSEWKVWKGIAGRRTNIVKEMWKTVEEVGQGMSAEEKAELRERLGLDE